MKTVDITYKNGDKLHFETKLDLHKFVCEMAEEVSRQYTPIADILITDSRKNMLQIKSVDNSLISV